MDLRGNRAAVAEQEKWVELNQRRSTGDNRVM